jgi:uncharacterized protein with GYD domain
MAIYFMFGKYSAESLKGVSAERSKKAAELVKASGGEIKSMFALLGGEHDLVFIVELPDTAHAIKASVALSRQTGIMFHTLPAITALDFDALITGN